MSPGLRLRLTALAVVPLAVVPLAVVPLTGCASATADTRSAPVVTADMLAHSEGQFWRLRSHSDIPADRIYAHDDAALSFGVIEGALVAGVSDGCNSTTTATSARNARPRGLRFMPDGRVALAVPAASTQKACADDRGRPVGFNAAALLRPDAR